jgi:hypothetical protein
MPQRPLSQSRSWTIGEPLPDHTLEHFARQGGAPEIGLCSAPASCALRQHCDVIEDRSARKRKGSSS